VQIEQKMADSLNDSLGKKWLMAVSPDMTRSDSIFVMPVKDGENSIGKKWLMLIVDNNPFYTQKLTLSECYFYNVIAVYLLEWGMKSKLVSLSLRKLNISVALLSVPDWNE